MGRPATIPAPLALRGVPGRRPLDSVCRGPGGPAPGGFLPPAQALRAKASSWRLQTPTAAAQTPSRDTTRHLPRYLPRPTYTHAYTRPTDGPADLSPASLIPRQESWGLTHWLADSHGSHLCAFVCVRPSATARTALYGGFASSSSSSSSTGCPCTPTDTPPCTHTHRLPLPLPLRGQVDQGAPGNRLALTLAPIPRHRTFQSPSSPVTEPLRLSLRNPRPTEVPCLQAWPCFVFL